MAGRIDEWTNRRMDEWQYILILTYIMSAHALGGWVGFVDELLAQLYPVP